MEERKNIPGVPDYTVETLAEKRSDYCLLIPIINEGGRILKELDRAKAAGVCGLVDIILCDGGSTDGSMALPGLKSRGVNCLLTKKGPGKQGAQLRMGLHFALERGYAGVLTIDGNNKDSIESVPLFIEKLKEGYDLVQGSRFIKGGKAVNTPPARWLAVRLIHAPVISLAARHWFTDTTNAYRAYSRAYLTHPAVQPLRDIFPGYELLAYLSVRATRLGLKACEVPVERAYPKNEPAPTKIKGFKGNSNLLKILFAALAGRYDPDQGRQHANGSRQLVQRLTESDQSRKTGRADRARPRTPHIGKAFTGGGMMKNTWLKRCGFVAAVFLCAAIITYITHCYETPESIGWQMDSEDIVWGRILQMQQGDENPGGMLGSYITPNMFAGYLKTAFLAGRVEGVFNPYASQSGLQGTIFGVMNLLFEKASLNTYLRWTIFRAANAAFFVAMMLFLSLWIWRRIGVLGAVAAFSCTIFSTYSTMTMPNLYWVTWTMLLPMVLSAAACDWLKKCGRRPAVWVTLVGISVLGRCMCGFEFVSVVMVATELPVVLEWLMAESKDRRAWFRLAVWMGIAQLAAFALAVVIWILQVYWMSGDWQMVRDAVLHTIAKRTGLFPKWAGENAAELESLKVSKLKVLLMYLPQKIFLDQFTILQIITIAAASFIPPALLGWKRSERRLELMRQAKFTGVALFSLAAPLSWHILASGHSWIHTHVNVFLWLIPAVPLLLAAAGGNLQLLAKIIRDRI